VPFDELLAQGIAAARAGNRQQARKLLAVAIMAAPNDERGWGWFFTVCENDQERLKCLGEVLRINPRLEAARKKYVEIAGRVSMMEAPKPEIQAEPQKEEPPPHAITKKCPFCGEEILENAVVCGYCGREAGKEVVIPAAAAPSPVPPQRKNIPKRKPRLVGYLIVTILVTGVIFLGLFLLQRYMGIGIRGGNLTLPNTASATDFVEIEAGWMCERGGGYMIFRGQVKNTSSQYDLKFVELRATVYNADGLKVNSAASYVDSELVLKDQTSTFGMLVENQGEGGRKCGLEVENAYFSE
jgi:hypothetical protein